MVGPATAFVGLVAVAGVPAVGQRAAVEVLKVVLAVATPAAAVVARVAVAGEPTAAVVNELTKLRHLAS